MFFSSSAQRVVIFNIGSGQLLEKILDSGSGRSVEIYDWIFSGLFITLGYFWVYRTSSLFLDFIIILGIF